MRREEFYLFFNANELNNSYWIERMFNLFDLNRNQSISLEEFLLGLDWFVSQNKENKIAILFQFYDLDQNGSIEKTEFLQLLLNYEYQDAIQIIDRFENQHKENLI